MVTNRGGTGVDQPAVGVSWNEAARFVNWLNTSQGHAVAYQFDSDGGNVNISLWEAGDTGFSANNPFRSTLAEYWLPSVDEWYKAAYYDPNSSFGLGGYNTHATMGFAFPTAVSGGNLINTAVYQQPLANGPADVFNAGGANHYGTVGQGGNVWEWQETAFDRVNSSSSESREIRGGSWSNPDVSFISAANRSSISPTNGGSNIGFRVAGSAPVALIPEPSTLFFSVIGCFSLLIRRRRP